MWAKIKITIIYLTFQHYIYWARSLAQQQYCLSIRNGLLRILLLVGCIYMYITDRCELILAGLWFCSHAGKYCAQVTRFWWETGLVLCQKHLGKISGLELTCVLLPYLVRELRILCPLCLHFRVCFFRSFYKGVETSVTYEILADAETRWIKSDCMVPVTTAKCQ